MAAPCNPRPQPQGAAAARRAENEAPLRPAPCYPPQRASGTLQAAKPEQAAARARPSLAPTGSPLTCPAG